MALGRVPGLVFLGVLSVAGVLAHSQAGICVLIVSDAKVLQVELSSQPITPNFHVPSWTRPPFQLFLSLAAECANQGPRQQVFPPCIPIFLTSLPFTSITEVRHLPEGAGIPENAPSGSLLTLPFSLSSVTYKSGGNHAETLPPGTPGFWSKFSASRPATQTASAVPHRNAKTMPSPLYTADTHCAGRAPFQAMTLGHPSWCPVYPRREAYRASH